MKKMHRIQGKLKANDLEIVIASAIVVSETITHLFVSYKKDTETGIVPCNVLLDRSDIGQVQVSYEPSEDVMMYSYFSDFGDISVMEEYMKEFITMNGHLIKMAREGTEEVQNLFNLIDKMQPSESTETENNSVIPRFKIDEIVTVISVIDGFDANFKKGDKLSIQGVEIKNNQVRYTFHETTGSLNQKQLVRAKK